MRPKILSLQVVAPALAILIMTFCVSRFFWNFETTMATRIYYTAMSAGLWITSAAYAGLWLERKRKADLFIAILWFLCGIVFFSNI